MKDLFRKLGIENVRSGACWGEWEPNPGGDELVSVNPTTGSPIGTIQQASAEDYENVVRHAQDRFRTWREVPAPRRGLIVRDLGEAFREVKAPLGKLVSLEMGKILVEGEGEVQEAIDMADLAVGMSRQLCGLSMHSERPEHRMYEQWHPLGTIGIITAFNFPCAVWAWNATVAAICGNTMIWKPSSKTPFVAMAMQAICNRVMKAHDVPGLFTLIVGRGATVGDRMLQDPRLPLISATGSCRMGRRVAQSVGARLGRSLLELGGNNAVLVMPSANLDLALRGVLFGAVGTAGQRCTSTRRLFLHKAIAGVFTQRLKDAYQQVRIGDPTAADTVMGPLVDHAAVEDMRKALAQVREQGGEVLCGAAERPDGVPAQGAFVQPTLVRARYDMPIVQEETFAPLLYVFEVDSLEEAIRLQNDVTQGLSSSIFTNDLREAETFLSARGSDCGIANVNLGTSGAEIGGAFGGEKETGGGREAGSDSWKVYMRRQTNTINWGADLPLAQGIQFG